MQRLVLIALAVAIVAGISGCQSAAAKKRKAEQAAAEQRQAAATANLAVTGQELVNADEETDKAMANLSETPPNVPMAKARMQSVKGSLGKAMRGVTVEDKRAAQTKRDYDAIRSRAEDCEKEQDKPLLAWTMWGIIAGGVIVVGSLAATIFAKSFTGIPWLSGIGDLSAVGWLLGGISMGLRLFIQAIGPYRWIIGIAAAGSISVAIVLVVWKGLKRGQLHKGFAEVVATAEAVKARPDVPTEAIAQEAAKIQSAETVALVQKIKADAADEADIAPPETTNP